MAIFFLWIVFTIIVTAFGSKRELGGVASFFISLILSPLIGLICVLLSNPLEPQRVVITNNNASLSVADELLKLTSLKEKGVITEIEFLKQKNALLGIEEKKPKEPQKESFLNKMGY